MPLGFLQHSVSGSASVSGGCFPRRPSSKRCLGVEKLEWMCTAHPFPYTNPSLCILCLENAAESGVFLHAYLGEMI